MAVNGDTAHPSDRSPGERISDGTDRSPDNVEPSADGGVERANRAVIDRLIAYAQQVAPDRPELGDTLCEYYLHADSGDLAKRPVEDLLGMAVAHLDLAARHQPGEYLISVTDPRVEIDGWGTDHTLVQVVTDDMPFLVDSVSMELNRLGLGIHLIVHPILTIGESALSMISVEIDRQAEPEDRTEIEENLRRILGDVTAAVADWQAMRARMVDVADHIRTASFPVSNDEQRETAELLEWLVEDHFLFLGARDYELVVDGDGDDALQAVGGSGLGILANGGGNGNGNGDARKLSSMPAVARARVSERCLLNLTKTGSLSTVHRAAYMDYIGIKTFDVDGVVVGERRFIGLFTSEVYNRSVVAVPRARETVKEILKRADYPPGGHDEKRLATILERYPRDDLLQTNADELYETAVAIAGLQERRRVRVFSRPEVFGRFVTVLVFLPRDRYNTDTRSSIEEVLIDAFGGSIADWDAQMSESILARLRFMLRLDPQAVEEPPTVDDDLEDRIESMIQVWDDGFADAIDQHFDESTSLSLRRQYAQAFNQDYQRAFNPRVAATDLEQILALDECGELAVQAYREPGRPTGEFKLKLYRRGERLSLTAIMPILSNLGVTVIDEWPFDVRTPGRDTVWIYDFGLEHERKDFDFAKTAALIEGAVSAVWDGTVEDDSFNRLVLGAGLAVADVAVLRAYAQYLQQVRLPYSPTYVAQTLVDYPEVTRLLFRLFATRFTPEEDEETVAIEKSVDVERELDDLISDIESLDHDRVLRRMVNAITATVRTTWAQRDDGHPLPYLAFKFACSALDDIPEPRPMYEIFTYSPRFEGVHLRAGPVARGGLRWSDRTEDYRTEVLGLVKAQMVKNAVIVPVGAKGGFVLKRRPVDREALSQEVVEVYQLFISSLLDLTDNLVDGNVVPPTRTRRWDGDDSYLVVAADKGTATFSDVANELAASRVFWLGDAFASGGSQGYDHKAMGITARGAWESVKRHFSLLGVDVQSEPFTAVGVGDMSGDVFGNGMLRSPFTRLVGAFDHRHIFIDPDPDPETSYRERIRLFQMGRSSWDDYNRDLISAGGGVFPRSAKSIELTQEMREALDVEATSMTPNQLMSAVLKAPVDLLWNGGIGTYVKHSDETDAEVGDKANDAIRVDGDELRCRVVGEGGNLGVTQRGRVEFARNGGHIFTDAIDNAGGVDSSDHEVNIKILLDEVVTNGDMTSKQRNELLAEMTEEVADLVLANNYNQALALSMARIDAPSLVDVHARYIDDMEQDGILDRRLEALPDADALAERKLARDGLTTPELAVLSAYTKNILSEELVDSDVVDDPATRSLLIDYFPEQLQERLSNRILWHRLRREITANRLANVVIDRAGVSMPYRLGQETSAPATEIAAAHLAAWEIYDLQSLVTEINATDGVLPVDQQLGLHLGCRRLAERAARALLITRPNPFDAGFAIDELAEPVSEAMANLSRHLVGSDKAAHEAMVSELMAAGASEELAQRGATLATGDTALDIVTVARSTGVDVDSAAATYFVAGENLGLTWLRDRITALPRDNRWSSQARLTLRLDLNADHRQLTTQILETATGGNDRGDEGDEHTAAEGPAGEVAAAVVDADAAVESWQAVNRRQIEAFRNTMVAIRATATPDLTTLLVAAREVRTLTTRTR